MVSQTRDGKLAAAFVALADTLVAGYDVVDLLQTLVDTCADLLDASAAGLLLADDLGGLEVVASTSESSRLVGIMQVHSGLGPSVLCYATGKAVDVADIAALDDDWSEFRTEALAQGFLSAYAVPLRLRRSIIGTLTLFRDARGSVETEDHSVAQGLADVATIGILHERALRESDVAQQQLQYALNSRVVIEQAKGVIAQTRNVDMDEAFRLLREYSRSNSLGLRNVAELIISRQLAL
ncbi:MAG: transcriptional regulator [Glaciihabitans sp.]|nr:transcriptional regulator [Glaciihabitans sp.]